MNPLTDQARVARILDGVPLGRVGREVLLDLPLDRLLQHRPRPVAQDLVQYRADRRCDRRRQRYSLHRRILLPVWATVTF